MGIRTKIVTDQYGVYVDDYNADMVADIDSEEGLTEDEKLQELDRLKIRYPRGLQVISIVDDMEYDEELEIIEYKFHRLIISVHDPLPSDKARGIASHYLSLAGTYCKHEYDCCANWYYSKPTHTECANGTIHIFDYSSNLNI